MARELGRPDPDALLARIKAQERAPSRGRLRIYLGAAAGVGKTYTMLEEAHRRKARGTDVVIGWVETHGRVHTAEQIGDLEIMPPGLGDARRIRPGWSELGSAPRRPDRILAGIARAP